MDIGGGSTELILGQGVQPEALESLSMGCVGKTERFFAEGKLTRKAFDRARTAAQLKLRPVKAFFRKHGWQEAIGASGTIRSAEAVARELGILQPEGLTLGNVEELIERMIGVGRIDRLDLPGLSQRRAQVWAGGLSILAEIFAALGVERMNISDGSLREGLLYDLVGRLQHADARERTVQALVERYHVDPDQSERAALMAGRLLAQAAKPWKLTDPLDAKLLEWAARLHEIGLDISHHNFHEHGAYIVEHADLPGFPRLEQQVLACLIASQRKRPDLDRLARLPEKKRKRVLRLALLLRLAVLLNRSRSADLPLDTRVVAGKRSLGPLVPGRLAGQQPADAGRSRPRDPVSETHRLPAGGELLRSAGLGQPLKQRGLRRVRAGIRAGREAVIAAVGAELPGVGIVLKIEFQVGLDPVAV